jgi:autotransporter-associated beta strand protein
MRKLCKLLPAVALAVASAEASAQLVYEPFDYGTASVGTNLGNVGPTTFFGYINPMSGNPYAIVSTNAPATGPFTNEATIASGNLNVPTGFVPASGNSLTYSGSLRSPRIGITAAPFTQASNATMYYSGVLKITDLTNVPVNAAGVFIAGFNNSVGTQTGQVTAVAARLHVRRAGALNDSTTDYELGIRNGTEVIVWDTQNTYTVGVSEPLVVASYQLVDGGTANDVGRMWINPDPSTFGAAVAPATPLTTTIDLSTNASNNNVASFIFRGDNALVPAGIQMDEVRVDTTWAQVTPPTGNTWTGAPGASWSTGSNWSTASAPNTANAFVNFANGPGGIVNVDAPQTVGTINIKSTGTYSIGGAALTLDGDAANGGRSAINVIPVMDATGGPPPADPVLGSNHTISSNLTLANGLAANIGKSQVLTLSGAVSGSGGLIKGGGGVLVLSGSNSFAGGVTVYNGTLAITSDAALGPVPGSPETNVTLTRTTLRFDAPVSLDVNRNIAIFGSTTALNPFGGAVDTNGNDVTINGMIGAGLAFTKQGAGTLTLTNAGNSFTNLAVNGGAVQVSSNDPLGLGSITLNGGALKFGAAFDIDGAKNVIMGAAGGTIDTNGFDTTMGTNIISGAALTKAGAGQLTLGQNNTYNGGTSVTGGVLNVFSDANLGAVGTAVNLDGGTLRWSGATFDMTNRPMTVGAGNGTVNIESASTTGAAGAVTGSGTLTKEGTGTFVAPHIRTGGLAVNNGMVRISPDSTANGVSKVGPLSVAAKLDLTDNKLITSSAAGTWNGTAYTGVAGLVDSARGSSGNAMWDGPTGITTSDTRAINNGDLVSIGVAQVSDVRTVANTETTTFAGQTVLGSDTLVMATWGGDANLDGKINIDDYGRIDGNVGQSGSVFGWSKGDFNYDGKINIDDYGIIDGNINRQGTPFAVSGGVALDGLAAVPEPASIGLVALGAMGLLGRRRRQRN